MNIISHCSQRKGRQTAVIPKAAFVVDSNIPFIHTLGIHTLDVGEENGLIGYVFQHRATGILNLYTEVHQTLALDAGHGTVLGV